MSLVPTTVPRLAHEGAGKPEMVEFGLSFPTVAWPKAAGEARICFSQLPQINPCSTEGCALVYPLGEQLSSCHSAPQNSSSAELHSVLVVFFLKKPTKNCIYYIFIYKYIYHILLCVYINIDIYLYIKTNFLCLAGLCLESRQHPWVTEPMEHGNREEKEFFPSPSFHLLLPQLPSPHMDEKEHHQTFPMFPIFCASPGKAPS